MKSWLKSKTVQSGIGAFLLLLVTTGIDIYNEKKVTQTHVGAVVGGAITLKGVIDGRANAKDIIYTPFVFDGPSKKDIDVNQKLEEMTTAAVTNILGTKAAVASTLPPDQTYIDSLPSASPNLSDLLEGIPDAVDESQSNGEFTREHLPENRNANYTVKIVHDTVVKTSLKDSSLLSDDEFLELSIGEEFSIDAYDKSEFNHLQAKFLSDGIWYYFYIPHITLHDNEGNQINLEDRTDEPVVVPVKKTPMNAPGYGTIYLEDPIYPGSNFYWAEFSKNGTRPPENKQQIENAVCAAKLLDNIREHFGSRPVIITSWFRPYAVNLKVGGASNSQHLNGGAVDFYIDGVTEQAIYDYVDPWHNGGLAIKHGQFVHIDCRDWRARWNY